MRRAGGFTLPEMLVVLSIVAVLLAAGMPSLRAYLQTQQVATTANEFLFALNLARSEAIQRSSRVDVAPRDGVSWESGWIVFVNKPGDATTRFDSGDQLLYSHDALPSGLRVATTLSDKSTPYIAYNGNGRSRANLSAFTPQWGSWRFSLGSAERLVRVNLVGRARLCNPADDPNCRFSQNAAAATRDNNP